MALDEDSVTHPKPVPGQGVNASVWYASARLRAVLASHTKPVTLAQALEPFDGEAFFREGAKLRALARGGLVERIAGRPRKYRLSAEARRAAGWAGAPKPDKTPERGFGGWAGELSAAIAEHCRVSVHGMLRGKSTGELGARARLCAALYARGWAPDSIDRYYGMDAGSAQVGIVTWMRLKATQAILGDLFPVDDIERGDTSARPAMINVPPRHGMTAWAAYCATRDALAAKKPAKPKRGAKVIPLSRGYQIRARRAKAGSSSPKDAA